MKIVITKSKIVLRDVLFFLLYFPRFKPLCIEYMPNLKSIYWLYSLLMIISGVLVGIMYFKMLIGKKMINEHLKFISSVIIYFSCFIFSSFINNQINIVRTIGTFFSIISFVMLIQVTCLNLEIRIFEIISHYLQLLIILNILIHVWKPHGLAQSIYYGNYIHFLANRNGLILIYMVAFAFMVTDYYLKEGSLTFRKKIWIAMIGITIIPFKSGTATLCMVGLILFLFFDKFQKWFTYIKVWSLYFGMTIVIVFMQITRYFKPIFDMVGKDADLTGRIVIWKSVIETITASTRNIFWGCGANTSVKFLYMGTWYSSHNMILELMLRGGTGALLAYMFVIICCKKRNSKYMQNKYNYYLNIILFFSLCASMTETPVFSPYIFVIMTFINMADVIILIEKARNR